MSKKSIPELSVDSRLLYQRLIEVNKGDIVSYEELSDIIKRDVQKEARGFLYTAMNMALRESGLVFEAVHNVGMKCLTDEENAKTTGRVTLKKIRRASLKGIRKIISVENFDGLSNDAKLQHNISLSVLGVMRAMTRPKKLALVENKFTATRPRLSFDKTVELFK